MTENNEENLLASKYQPTKVILQSTVFFDHPVISLNILYVTYSMILLPIIIIIIINTVGTPKRVLQCLHMPWYPLEGMSQIGLKYPQ